MSITLELPPDVEGRLAALASDRNESVASFAARLVEEGLPGVLVPNPELARAIARMASRTPEELEQAQQRARESLRARRLPPEGMTPLAAVVGQWPGDESDEEVYEALERLS